MNISILRGHNQIGGNIIEIVTNTNKILLDIGSELDDDNSKLPEIDGLFKYKGYDAVFISHYHGDHLGLAYSIDREIPLYIGENSYKIVKAVDGYKNTPSISPSGFLSNGIPIQVGNITITPYLCDHSAFDSYMFVIQADNECALYTGDFRSNGRKSYSRLLQQLPQKVDTLICEGTTLSRPANNVETEVDLEEKADALFAQTTAPIFALLSAMNIDRVVTLYKAAKKSNRLLLQDLYMTEITSAIGGNIPNPVSFPAVRTFISRGYDQDHFRYKLFDKYGDKKISRSQICGSQYVMCVRASMLKYLESINEREPLSGGLLIYSMWEGYQKKDQMHEFLSGCENLGLQIVSIHTSGHADPETIKALISHTNPNTIIPIHTENAQWFAQEYGNRVKVLDS